MNLGKPAGGDLLQGNITLPVLYAMEHFKIREEILKVNEQTGKAEIDNIISMVKKSDAIKRSFELSDRYLDKALTILEDFPQNKAKKALREIALYIGKRKF